MLVYRLKSGNQAGAAADVVAISRSEPLEFAQQNPLLSPKREMNPCP
jgi:hypothetical protein